MRKRANRLLVALSVCCFLSLLIAGGAWAQTVSIGANPSSGTAPLVVQFTGVVDFELCDSYWEFGDGEEGYGLSPSHTFQYAGDYTVTFHAYDWEYCNDYTATTVIHVEAPPEPTVSIQADPMNGVTPQLVNFTLRIQGYVDGYDIDWDFGDGGGSSGTTTSYTYQQAGDYTVTAHMYDYYRNKTFTATTMIHIVTPKLEIGSMDNVHWGDTISVPITLTTEGVEIASLGEDIRFDEAKLTFVDVVIGPAAQAAGKELFYEVNPQYGYGYDACYWWWGYSQVRIGIIGPENNTAIGDGVIAYLVFTVNANIAQGQNITTIEGCPSASSKLADPIQMAGEDGRLNISHLWADCSTIDGGVDIAEVYAAIDMFLGRLQTDPCYDRNMSGYITIDEVQLAILNFLGIVIPDLGPMMSALASARDGVAPSEAAAAPKTPVTPILALKAAQGSAGETVTLPLVFSGKRAGVSGVSVDILYDPNLLGSPSATVGPAGDAAGKDVFFDTVGPGKLRVGLAGVNKDTLQNGVVAYVSFTIQPNAKAKRTTLSYITSAANPRAEAVSLKNPSRTTAIRILKAKKK